MPGEVSFNALRRQGSPRSVARAPQVFRQIPRNLLRYVRCVAPASRRPACHPEAMRWSRSLRKERHVDGR
jgi:hypothetical protein